MRPEALKEVKAMPIGSLFMRTFLPLMLGAILLAGLITRMLYENELSIIKLQEQALLERGAISLQKNLQPPQQHLISLRKEKLFLDSLRNPEGDLRGMENTFSSLLTRNKNYFQVRWIDQNGRERLRMERDSVKKPAIRRTPNDQLQDKSERYYFKQTLKLSGSNQLYLSPMDLNVERGKIERPYRPTLRMAIPLADSGQPRGILIINIDARDYLSELQQVLENHAVRIQLINPEGFWLHHKDSALEWGFQLSHKKKFKTQHADIWQEMHNLEQTHSLTDSGLWSWHPLYPDNDPKVFNNHSMGFLLLKRAPAELNLLRLKFWGGGLLILLIILSASGYQLYRLLKAQQAQQTAEQLALQNQIQADKLRKQREDEQRFRVIFNASHTPLLVCNGHGDITLVNPALEALFGYSAFELTGLPVEHLIPVAMRKAHVKERTEYLNHLRPRRKMMKDGQSLQGIRKDGSLVDVEIGLSPYESEGEIFILATLEDISARIESERQLKEIHTRKTRHLERAREDAERLAKLKSDFLANMSHEIRTPLNAILVLGELLEQEALPENAQALSHNIRTAGENLLHIVNDVLDFSKIEAGGLTLETAPFCLQNLLGQLLALNEAQAERKGLKLHLNTGGTDRLTLVGDQYRLSQILLNLVSNGIKFTDAGKVSIHVKALNQDSKKATLSFSVTDTGPGIDEAQQEAIFNAFTQADNSVTREYGGTGLGLAISQQLIKLMGGDLTLKSQPGQGACFSFTLTFPLAESEQQRQQPDAEPIAISLKGKKLLVADDSPLNRDIAKRIIERAEGTVVLAEDGAQALQMIDSMAQERPDLIMMDLQMPVMDGYEAIRQIRANADYNHTPVIALTAGITESAHLQAIEAGADQVLTKPFTLQQIMTCLQDYLSAAGDNATSGHPDETSAVKEATAATTSTDSNSYSPPDLPVLDEATALFNWGDKASLQHFLKQFVTQYSDCGEELEQLLNNNQRDKAESLAHKVKGAAGSLYLLALQQELNQLEQQLRDHNEQTETIKKHKLPVVSAILAKTLNTISGYV